ncbi:hypothetical protein J0A67_03165 [Algoriphagus aestuariicola]|uniref:Uncharacterized protein n=1 Tax=Algoriphagus aestuariicola TaxID=1852016 RepID=A0ABS3BKM2_9BACT|nr:hypothetical protein [Algoriphagus aestuariicola]MBN7799841.1 hypothetical protein [Algoriphagus aestuariicola]
MQKAGSIKKDKQLSSSQDFNVLMERGLAYVQGYSGDIWTDYNAHDPGVTILEQFCYGLTELGYKAAFPIEDLLVEEADGRINWRKNSFYSPALVFSSHPFTVSDFRKLLIDSFPEIQNCWLELVHAPAKESGVNGVYQVEVLPALAFQKELKGKPDLSKVFLGRLHRFLKENRNLGEDFDPPKLLAPHFIFMQANVEISDEEDPDQILAEILFALEVHLYHPVAYTNLEELQKTGIRLEDIFVGPRLAGGFIQDKELKERSKTLYTEKFILLISKIPGVKKCWDVAIDREGRAKSLALGEHAYAAINTDPKDPQSIFSTLKIYVNGNLQRLDKARVADLLLDYWSRHYRVYQEDLFRDDVWSGEFNGRYRNPGAYTSIREHFPGIYGLKPGEISSHEPEERHAKVKQLKGYLLLMEKQLANFLAQLAHLPDFFDQDIGYQGTYFSQNPDLKAGDVNLEIPSKLVSGFNGAGINPQTGESRISWLKRKNRVLDHLLARFGESIQDLPFQLSLKLNLLGNEEEMYAALLLQKSRFLRQVGELNYGKHRAQFQSPDQQGDFSTLEKILRLVTGIGDQPESLLPRFLPKNVTEKESASTGGFLKSQSSYLDLLEKFRQLSKQERNFPQIPNPTKSAYSFGKVGIKNLFSRTLEADSYWISREPSRVGTVEVLFQKSESNWVGIWEGNSESDAIQAIANNIQYFRALNATAEGMYLVDHILMRSMLDGGDYGFVVLDEWGRPTFKSEWKSAESERRALLAKFYQAATEQEAFRMSGDGLGLYGKEGELLATYLDYSDSDYTAVIESMGSLSKMMSGDDEVSGLLSLHEIEGLRYRGTLHQEGVFRQRSVVFLRKLENGKEVREDFFDLKASLVLPDWPSRFQESHFRYFLTNEVRDRVPAHMEVQVYWLSLIEFGSFESCYKTWWEHFKSQAPRKQLAESAYSLYEKLLNLKGVENG